LDNAASRDKNNTSGFIQGHIDALFKPTIQKFQLVKGWQAAYNGYWYRNEWIITAIRGYNQEEGRKGPERKIEEL